MRPRPRGERPARPNDRAHAPWEARVRAATWLHWAHVWEGGGGSAHQTQALGEDPRRSRSAATGANTAGARVRDRAGGRAPTAPRARPRLPCSRRPVPPARPPARPPALTTPRPEVTTASDWGARPEARPRASGPSRASLRVPELRVPRSQEGPRVRGKGRRRSPAGLGLSGSGCTGSPRPSWGEPRSSAVGGRVAARGLWERSRRRERAVGALSAARGRPSPKPGRTADRGRAGRRGGPSARPGSGWERGGGRLRGRGCSVGASGRPPGSETLGRSVSAGAASGVAADPPPLPPRGPQPSGDAGGLSRAHLPPSSPRPASTRPQWVPGIVLSAVWAVSNFCILAPRGGALSPLLHTQALRVRRTYPRSAACKGWITLEYWSGGSNAGVQGRGGISVPPVAG